MSAIREKNIMVLFVSANSANAMKNPKAFAILGETHKSRQTNESAVRYMYQLLRRQGKRLDHIFLITSKASKRKVNLAGPGEAEDRKSPLDVLYELMDELSLRELCRTKDYDEDALPVLSPRGYDWRLSSCLDDDARRPATSDQHHHARSEELLCHRQDPLCECADQEREARDYQTGHSR